MDERTQNERLSPWVIVGRVVFTLALAGCIWFIFSNSMAVAQVSSASSGRVLTLLQGELPELGSRLESWIERHGAGLAGSVAALAREPEAVLA